jgi:hypothetical protein
MCGFSSVGLIFARACFCYIRLAEGFGLPLAA